MKTGIKKTALLFLTAIFMLSVSNALFAVHLESNCKDHCHENDQSDHESEDCSICQNLLVTSGQVFTEPNLTHSESVNVSVIDYTPHLFKASLVMILSRLVVLPKHSFHKLFF